VQDHFAIEYGVWGKQSKLSFRGDLFSPYSAELPI